MKKLFDYLSSLGFYYYYYSFGCLQLLGVKDSFSIYFSLGLRISFYLTDLSSQFYAPTTSTLQWYVINCASVSIEVDKCLVSGHLEA